MKVSKAEPSSAAGQALDAPSRRLPDWLRTKAQQQMRQDRTARRGQGDEADAPSGWWLMPAVCGGLLAWVWLIRGLVGWTANLL